MLADDDHGGAEDIHAHDNPARQAVWEGGGSEVISLPFGSRDCPGSGNQHFALIPVQSDKCRNAEDAYPERDG